MSISINIYLKISFLKGVESRPALKKKSLFSVFSSFQSFFIHENPTLFPSQPRTNLFDFFLKQDYPAVYGGNVHEPKNSPDPGQHGEISVIYEAGGEGTRPS